MKLLLGEVSEVSENDEYIEFSKAIPVTQMQRIIDFIVGVLVQSSEFPSISDDRSADNELLFLLRDHQGIIHTCEMLIRINDDAAAFGVALDGCSQEECPRIQELRTNLLLHFMTEDPFLYSLNPPPEDRDEGRLQQWWTTAMEQYANRKWDDCLRNLGVLAERTTELIFSHLFGQTDLSKTQTFDARLRRIISYQKERKDMYAYLGNILMAVKLIRNRVMHPNKTGSTPQDCEQIFRLLSCTFELLDPALS